MTGFERFILDNHPDPDSMVIMETNLFDKTKFRIGYETEQICLLAERYAEAKVKEKYGNL